MGFFTLLAARLCPLGRVFAFEPLSENVDFLKDHCRLGHLKNVQVFPLAVGSANGESFFSLGKDTSTGKLSSSGSRTTTVRQLDRIIVEHGLPNPDVLKMDIEGGEVEALIGAKRLLTNALPIIFLSVHGPDLERECVKLLQELGYFTVGSLAANLEPDEIVAFKVSSLKSGSSLMRFVG